MGAAVALPVKIPNRDDADVLDVFGQSDRQLGKLRYFCGFFLGDEIGFHRQVLLNDLIGLLHILADLFLVKIVQREIDARLPEV